MFARKIARVTILAIAGLAMPISAVAENLIYNPFNPGLGGNSNNYDYLQGLAEIQNQHLPAASGRGGGSTPDFSFPPIVIDLGGVGLSAAPDVVPDPAASQ